MRFARAARLALGAACALAAFACRKSAAPAAGSVRGGPPRGDAVWFTDAAAAGDAGIEDRLARVSAAVFLPARRSHGRQRALGPSRERRPASSARARVRWSWS